MKSIFITLLLFLNIIVYVFACDAKWVRYVYYQACNKRKRHNPDHIDYEPHHQYRPDPRIRAALRMPPGNETLGARLMRAMLGMEEFRQTTGRENIIPRRPLRNLTSPALPPLPFLRFSGMRDVDSAWIVEELLDGDTNDHHRRAVSEVLKKCCGGPPAETCTAKDFMGACK